MTRRQSEQRIFDEKLKPYYHIVGKEYLCRKCEHHIGSRREEHYKSCVGIGVRKLVRESFTLPSDATFIDTTDRNCDLGCGQKSAFFYKNGKAYCCKLGNSCPIKKQQDSQAKKGINPFEGKEHHRCQLGKPSWNKGLTKNTHPSLKIAGEAISKHFELFGDQRKNKNHTPESKAKIAKATKERGQGGYKPGSGIGISGWYKGIFCDSSWELAYVIYCLEHNMSIQRSTEKRTYMWQGKMRKYLPDFVVDGKTVEIKGYTSLQWEAKYAENTDITVLFGPDLEDVFSYVKNKYGKDYVKLYDKK